MLSFPAYYFTRAALSRYNRETEAVIAAMTGPPTAARMKVLDNLVGAMKGTGIWERLDIFYVMAAHDAQASLLNWKNPGTFNLTAVSAPTFTADRGYLGNGTSSYLDTNFNPTTAGGQFAQNDATAFAWNRNASVPYGTCLLGSASGYLTRVLSSVPTTNNCFWGINGSTPIQAALPSATGLFSATRSEANELIAYKDGVSVGTSGAASSAMANTNLNLLHESGGFSTAEVVFAGAGRALTSDQHLALNVALDTYRAAVGA